jgi:transcription initiation factor TFIID subunit 12
MAPLVGQRIQDLLASLDPSYTMDAQAQEQVLQLADDFLDKVCKQSLRMAAHRGSSTVEVQDVQLILAKQWGIVIPGLGPLALNKAKILPASAKAASSSSHSTGGGGNKRKASTMSKSGGTSQSQPPQSKPSSNLGGETVPMNT